MILLFAAAAAAHDLFIKPERFHVAESSDVFVRVLNGTFDKSENSIARDRLVDVSVVSPAGRARLDTVDWNTAGDTSTFRFKTGGAGTYLLGVSTRSRTFQLAAKDFNAYLEEDGIPDVLAARRRNGELGKAARERYSKHVKALVQVGDATTEQYAMALGYTAEIVPVENPYTLHPGTTLHVRTLVDGALVANQLVMYGGRTGSGAKIARRSTRSNANGVASIPLRTGGVWYLEFIHMTRQPAGGDADYESKWATLTFEVR
jgi:uncharacterized GH25 family protein